MGEKIFRARASSSLFKMRLIIPEQEKRTIEKATPKTMNIDVILLIIDLEYSLPYLGRK